MYLCTYLESFTDIQIDILLKKDFEIYTNNSNKIRKIILDKTSLDNSLSIFERYNIIPGYSLIEDNILYDFDEDNVYIKNNLIEENFGEEFLVYLLETLLHLNDHINTSKKKLYEILQELSYDYMVNMNIWNKYGFARLYINEKSSEINLKGEKLGFIDLINYKVFTDNNNKSFLNDLLEDKRIKSISKYFLIKEGYI